VAIVVALVALRSPASERSESSAREPAYDAA
jgi:hypothetical protein